MHRSELVLLASRPGIGKTSLALNITDFVAVEACTPTPNPFGGEDQVVMNPGRGNPNILKAAGPTDPEVALLSIQAADGRPIALVANYSLHYVGPAAGPVISADYFGIFGGTAQTGVETYSGRMS